MVSSQAGGVGLAGLKRVASRRKPRRRWLSTVSGLSTSRFWRVVTTSRRSIPARKIALQSFVPDIIQHHKGAFAVQMFLQQGAGGL
ncbi:MAG: hypothetical protein R3E39_08955 [Anaerolineae bacterium]